jgi:hypothetical protein
MHHTFMSKMRGGKRDEDTYNIHETEPRAFVQPETLD